MLFGVVKKNAILQVDYTNVLRERGLPRHDAVMKADHARLRPILMTTVSIIAGMLPIALGKGDGSSSRAAMATVRRRRPDTLSVAHPAGHAVIYTYFDDLRSLRIGTLAKLPTGSGSGCAGCPRGSPTPPPPKSRLAEPPSERPRGIDSPRLDAPTLGHGRTGFRRSRDEARPDHLQLHLR